MNLNFFFEVLIGGLLSGVMYALVALGFVLIYKASGVFNFAQGAMVFFAALTCVSLTEFGWPLWVAIAATIVIMSLLGLAVERVVLRPLVNQPEISLFMATIGLSFFIEGMAQLMWGSDVKRLDLGIEDVPMESLMQSFSHQSRPRTARRRRRSSSRARCWHPTPTNLGHRLERRRICGAGCRIAVGFTQWRTVCINFRRTQSTPRTYFRRLYVSTWCDYWWLNYRHLRKAR